MLHETSSSSYSSGALPRFDDMMSKACQQAEIPIPNAALINLRKVCLTPKT